MIQPTKQIPGQDFLIQQALVRGLKPGRILDIGTGSGNAAIKFHEAGWNVEATGYNVEAYYSDGQTWPAAIKLHEDVDVCDMHIFEDASFDAIWCAHVLEHVLDTGVALREIRRILKPGGTLFVSVPPFKHQVVGGHVVPGWNVGILMYVLAVAGFDLSGGSFIKHGYNIFGTAQKGEGPLPEGLLNFANGDIETLAKEGRFPKAFPARQGFDGNIDRVNWTTVLTSTNRLKKIAFFVPWITKGRGGTENVGQMMANSMASKGYEVDIFTFDDDQSPSKWPLDERIRLHHLSEKDGREADLQLMVDVAQSNPDLIVGLHMNRTFKRYVKCAQRLNIPIVLSEHIDPAFPQRIGTFSKKERDTCFSGATHIHMLVEPFKQTLPPAIQYKVSVIPNTVPPAQKLAQPDKADGQKTLITVARLVPRKNISRLIKIFARISPTVPEWRLQIVGTGGQKNELEALADELSISSKIDFAGHTDSPYQYYADSHLFVLPSLYEGFPMTGIEAMAHGLPLVGYRVCNGINQQIEHERNGLLSSGGQQQGSLGADLLTLMQDDQKRAEMGAQSLQKFNEEFSNEVVFGAWENLFLMAVEEHLVKPPRPSMRQ